MRIFVNLAKSSNAVYLFFRILMWIINWNGYEIDQFFRVYGVQIEDFQADNYYNLIFEMFSS